MLNISFLIRLFSFCGFLHEDFFPKVKVKLVDGSLGPPQFSVDEGSAIMANFGECRRQQQGTALLAWALVICWAGCWF